MQRKNRDFFIYRTWRGCWKNTTVGPETQYGHKTNYTERSTEKLQRSIPEKKTNRLMDRHKFLNRKQKDDESLKQFWHALNSYGRPVVAVPPMRAGEVIAQMPQLSQSNANNSLSDLHRNGPIRPVPITPMVIPQEIPIVIQSHQNNRTRGILQTPLKDQNFNPNTQQHMSSLIGREAIPFQHSGITSIQHPGNLDNSRFYYNHAGQLYLDPQGTHNNPGPAEVYPPQAYSSMQEQPTHRRMQLNRL